MRKQKAVDEADGQASGVAGEVLGNVRMVAALEAESRIEERYKKWTQISRVRGMSLSYWVGAQFAPSKYLTAPTCIKLIENKCSSLSMRELTHVRNASIRNGERLMKV